MSLAIRIVDEENKIVKHIIDLIEREYIGGVTAGRNSGTVYSRLLNPSIVHRIKAHLATAPFRFTYSASTGYGGTGDARFYLHW